MDEDTVNQGAAGGLWTYGDLILNTSELEAIYAVASGSARDRNLYRAIKARMTTGRTYILAEYSQDYSLSLQLDETRREMVAYADKWAEEKKAEIVAELNAFLSKAD